MVKNNVSLWGLLIIIMLVRLLFSIVLPFADTTEARYAEIARIMAGSGDWITPWFNDGIPFWGKPPLSFWLQAISFNIFGFSEFAGRFPSWLASVGIIAMIYRIAISIFPIEINSNAQNYGVLAGLIYATSTLGFVSSATVMTDTFFTLGVVLTLGSFIIRIKGGHIIWSWIFFVGLVIGTLSKGPLTFVITLVPIVVWTALFKRWSEIWKLLPWVSGSILMLILTLPWYLLAELKTPGFIDYFIVGEHFKRFVVSGWEGDLYGNAHDYQRGTIWVFLIFASLPWSAIILFQSMFSGKHVISIYTRLQENHKKSITFLAICSFTPIIFFTFSVNIIWTYVLPSLPFISLIFALFFSLKTYSKSSDRLNRFAVLLAPMVFTLIGFNYVVHPNKMKTEKGLIEKAREISTDSMENFFYVGSVPFSARFYSQNRACGISRKTLIDWTDIAGKGASLLLAVPKKDKEIMTKFKSASSLIYENRRYYLLSLESELNDNPPLFCRQ